MTDHRDTPHEGDRPIEYEPGVVQRAGEPATPAEATNLDLDARARRAALGLRRHVDQHLADAPHLAAVAPSSRSHRPWRTRVLAVAAVAALVVGFAATQGPDGSGGDRVDVDDPRRPELAEGLLTPLGPRDGKDSIQLPVTVEPSVGLRAGDEVTARAEGFVPGESVGIVQCAREAGGDSPEARGGVDGCYIGDYVNVQADEQGVAQGTYVVKRILTTPLTGSIDCAAEPGRCIIAMGAISDYDRSGGMAIELDPDVEPVELPTVEVLPTEDLADGQKVRVVGTGLTPGEVMWAEVCSADPSACWSTGVPVTDPEGYASLGLPVDGEGRIDVEVPVWRFLPGGEPGTYVDCAVSRCSLRLSGSTAPPTVPLRFRGDEPPPTSAAFGAEPTTGVAPGDEIVLAGEGFRPGTQVWISLCSQPVETSDLYGGACTGLGDMVVIDEAGAFAVSREVPEPPMFGEQEMCDADGRCQQVASRPTVCDDVTDRCTLVVEGEWYGYSGDGQVVEAVPPTFPPAPVPITYRR